MDSSYDALDAYLAEPIIPSVQDPLKYWEGMSYNNTRLPRMCLDFLSVPGEYLFSLLMLAFWYLFTAASTDVERGFSKGRLTVSCLRHSLSDESTRAETVLGSWANIAGLVSNDDLIDNIRKKRFRWAKEDVIAVD